MKGFDEKSTINFKLVNNNNLFNFRNSNLQPIIRLENKSEILSIKFSPDYQILSVQRSSNTIDFINFTNGLPASEFSHSAKVRLLNNEQSIEFWLSLLAQDL